MNMPLTMLGAKYVGFLFFLRLLPLSKLTTMLLQVVELMLRVTSCRLNGQCSKGNRHRMSGEHQRSLACLRLCGWHTAQTTCSKGIEKSMDSHTGTRSQEDNSRCGVPTTVYYRRPPRHIVHSAHSNRWEEDRIESSNHWSYCMNIQGCSKSAPQILTPMEGRRRPFHRIADTCLRKSCSSS